MNYPRQAIRVTFVNPTDRNLNPRFRAKCSAGSLVRECDDDVDHVENAHRTAIALCEKLGWDASMFVAGGLDNDGYVYVDATEAIQAAIASSRKPSGKRGGK